MLNYLIKTGNNCFFIWLSNFCPLEVPSDQNLNLLIVCRTDPARFWAGILNSGSVTILQPALVSAQEVSIQRNFESQIDALSMTYLHSQLLGSFFSFVFRFWPFFEYLLLVVSNRVSFLVFPFLTFDDLTFIQVYAKLNQLITSG